MQTQPVIVDERTDLCQDTHDDRRTRRTQARRQVHTRMGRDKEEGTGEKMVGTDGAAE